MIVRSHEIVWISLLVKLLCFVFYFIYIREFATVKEKWCKKSLFKYLDSDLVIIHMSFEALISKWWHIDRDDSNWGCDAIMADSLWSCAVWRIWRIWEAYLKGKWAVEVLILGFCDAIVELWKSYFTRGQQWRSSVSMLLPSAIRSSNSDPMGRRLW